MQTITKYLVLLVLSLNVQLINAQDTIQSVNNKDKISTLKSVKEAIKNQEREFLKIEVEAINLRLDNRDITNEVAEKLKKEAAQKRALNIENRLTIINNKIALLERNEDGYTVDNEEVTDKVGFSIGDEGSFAGFNINGKINKPRKYDLRTSEKCISCNKVNTLAKFAFKVREKS